MKQSGTNCKYPVIEKYFNESDFRDAIDHVLKCNDCLNQVLKIDRNLVILNSTKIMDSSMYDENELSVKIEEYLISGNKQKSSEYKNDLENQTIIHMQNFLANYENMNNIKTPGYLKNTVLNEIINKKLTQPNIIIKISEGLKLIANYIDNIIVIPEELVPVMVRSGIDKNEEEPQGSINFVQILDDGKVHYNVIKDGPESVLLTVSIDNEDIKPDYINLRSLNQIVLSQRLNDNYVYFPKLKEGNYCVEFKYRSKENIFSIPISIV